MDLGERGARDARDAKDAKDALAAMDGSTESLSGELLGARPGGDAVGMEDVRARAERALFGAAEPARLGRYVLLGPIAGGGMGVVYGAYDPQLDRRVALKLLHPHQRGAPHAHARLSAEARALAQLDDPNVVPIHDVLEVDGQIVLVMELVAGQTLAAWERAGARSWREIIAAYVQAGRGLAAAHRIGLAHRDFKPANAIIGDDGRVRVLDFGLVRFAEAGESVPTEPWETLLPAVPSLTVTGEVLGTVAFMAPEQLRGRAATAASDQFGFCVALHRALHGVPPFAGTSIDELLTGIEARRIAESPRRARAVPGWLRAVIARGLAPDPAARFPSMADLLAELERERGWRRWRVPAAIAAAAAATAIAIIVLLRSAPVALPPCDGGADEIGAIWGPGRHARVAAALAATTAPGARGIAERTLGLLDEYRDAWSGQHRDACVAHRKGTQSDHVLDRRMACLDRRRGALASSADVIEQIGRTTIDRAIEVAARMPPVDDCGDLALLEAEREPPATLVERSQVAALAQRINGAEARERAGRSAEALVDALGIAADARRIGYPPALVDALLVEGRLRLFRDEYAAARASLLEAERLALEQGMLSAAVVAGARRIYADGMDGRGLERLLGEAAVLERISHHLPGDQFARPLLLNNIGVLHMSRDQRAEARAAFEAAREALRGVEAPDLELVNIDKNLAMITPDPARRRALARAAWERLRDRLGPGHLMTLEALLGYSRYVAEPAEALPLADQACRLYHQLHPEAIRDRTECAYHQALLAAHTGAADRAAALRDDLVAFAAGSSDPPVAAWRELAACELALQRGAAGAALARCEAVRARHAGQPDMGDRQVVAHALLGAGQAERALGRAGAALAHLDESAAMFAELTSINEEAENHRSLAITHRVAAALRAELARRR